MPSDDDELIDTIRGVTTDSDEFRDRWNSYIDDLSGVKSALPGDRMSEVDELQEELKELVDLGAKVFNNEVCWNCESEVGGEEQERCGNCGVKL